MRIDMIKFAFFLVALCAYTRADYLDDFLKGTFASSGWNGTWRSDHELFYKLEDDYVTYDFTTEVTAETLKKSFLEKYKNPVVTISPLNDLYLIRHDENAVFRHSKTAKYAVYDGKNVQEINEGKPLQLCKWSNSMNALVYVSENSLYYIKEAKNVKDVVQVMEGNADTFNGVADWVYEEEVLASGSAVWFSPNDMFLAFIQFTDNNVKDLSYITYGDLTNQYPNVNTIKYPKVATQNPNFKLMVYDVQNKNSKEMSIIEQGKSSNEFVLFGVTWFSNSIVTAYITNRIQNEGSLKECDIMTTKCTDMDTYTSEDGWLEPHMPLFKGTEMFQIKYDNDYSSLVYTANKKSVVLTKDQAVTRIHGVSGDLVYYSGSRPKKYTEQHVYSRNYKDETEPNCLTCDLEVPEGKCKYADASFYKDMSYAVLTCRGPGPASIYISKLADSTLITLEENKELRKKLSAKPDKFKTQDLTIKLTNGNEAFARVYVPGGDSESVKYPVIVNVYGGPGSNQISDAYSFGFEQHLVNRKKFVYVLIDASGSGRRGNTNQFRIYKKLGTLEIEDQIEATKKLLSQLSFVDPENVCIWGWSYGGFATAWALAKDKDHKIFKCGVSVAPVTNFLNYDSIYTERFMGEKKDNEDAYKLTDITAVAEKINGSEFLLVHGNADDNVHYQHSMLLAKALELKNIPFQQMSYPDENHSLKSVLPHLYNTIDNFFDAHLVYNFASSTQPMFALLLSVLALFVYL
ncbi:PREDICTED: venom dipeptidyl peptidase 4-like [Nicrophorus vespilloides]|uniref:Venom dipeptidyl peptidase 4-like n=1 Tax=Nicrophorus vespilloides TaxID=110193 RepID=A0ABM1M880_NICVS|nr:PREDICTED: venom dipeptidyl peptidase 4-like [Nicrophorus vespilloides]XP_017770781.1 PREDICTED: venom dipeptidyl peptidase 4-like [Nicrophorus vespilloides]